MGKKEGRPAARARGKGAVGTGQAGVDAPLPQRHAAAPAGGQAASKTPRVASPQRACVGYIRVSTREQAETKLSLTHQEEKIRAYAVSQDLELSHIYNDAAESAKDLKRTSIQELLKEVERGRIGHVIILKLDRLVRNLENLGYIIRLFDKKDVTLSSVSESLNTATASGRMVVHLLGAIAQWERETIAERTQAALDVKRRKGEKLGGIVPYGYRAREGKLVAYPPEQKVLLEIRRRHLNGDGYQFIAEALNEAGTRPRKGKRWWASTVRGILLRGSPPGDA